MDTYSYSSYGESGDSSPRSREIEFDSDTSNNTHSYRAKFMCSYGGKILPRPNGNTLCYVGGETKILAVDRSVKLSTMLGKLSSIFAGEEVSFKYQLPGEDLDALISVTNDDDLDLMMCEYDRLYRSNKPIRMRIFLFPTYAPTRFSAATAINGDNFVEALNLGPILPELGLSSKNPNPVDFLFGLEKYVTPSAPPAPLSVHAPPPPEISRAVIYPGDNNNNNNNNNQYYKIVPEQKIPVSAAGFWPTSIGFPAPAITQNPVYVIPASSAAVVPRGVPLPMTSSPAGKVVPVSVAPAAVVPSIPYIPPPPPLPAYSAASVPPPKISAVAMGRVSGGFTVAGTDATVVPYGPVNYDGATGRHVYYATPSGVVVGPPVPPHSAVRGGAGIGMESKMVIAKVP